MQDKMKEELNSLLVTWMVNNDEDCNLDEGLTQHVVDLMCDAVEVVYDTATKVHLFLMGS